MEIILADYFRHLMGRYAGAISAGAEIEAAPATKHLNDITTSSRFPPRTPGPKDPSQPYRPSFPMCGAFGTNNPDLPMPMPVPVPMPRNNKSLHRFLTFINQSLSAAGP
ncbi:hypothetical protein VM1G_04178 [Cytospora mali]|uniref:Uncharacterized protein n=1 Tax=Cytospora mali TaxID=578113 RepID=A0A194VXW1_CYTMA|nr:hypothetical protein VM1G_04178 [Valsa mali]